MNFWISKRLFGLLSILLLVADTGSGSNQAMAQEVEQRLRAAELGEVDVQFAVGHMYWFGNGVVEDRREAVRWFHKAAERGHGRSQIFLGEAYWMGEGTFRDKREAARWYRKAAEQGFGYAQAFLSYAYFYGDSVVKDEREAYVWAAVGSASGNEVAAEFLNNIKWKNHLSRSEIRSAQQEAKKRMAEITDRQQQGDESAEKP